MAPLRFASLKEAQSNANKAKIEIATEGELRRFEGAVGKLIDGVAAAEKRDDVEEAYVLAWRLLNVFEQARRYKGRKSTVLTSARFEDAIKIVERLSPRLTQLYTAATVTSPGVADGDVVDDALLLLLPDVPLSAPGSVANVLTPSPSPLSPPPPPPPPPLVTALLPPLAPALVPLVPLPAPSTTSVTVDKLVHLSVDELYVLLKNPDGEPNLVLLLDVRAKEDFLYSHFSSPLFKLALVNIPGAALHAGVASLTLEQQLGSSSAGARAFARRADFRHVIIVGAESVPAAAPGALVLKVHGWLRLGVSVLKIMAGPHPHL